ncbi:hypothetical protein DL769_005541 [Monosporascus sp. CRB-8-3]|nr:hypothetical protein DL769_005541 [Monosporascus sp. CRB-8-3]
MAYEFRANELVPGYQKASDVEHVEGEFVHPKKVGAIGGYIKKAIIVAIAGKLSDNGGEQHGAGSVYFGPGSDWNKGIHIIWKNANAQDAQAHAVSHAFEAARTLKLAPRVGFPMKGSQITQLIIKTDSDFLADVVTSSGMEAIMAKDRKSASGGSVKELFVDPMLREIKELNA